MTPACLFCHCTEDDPCRLGGGDTCVLDVQSMACNNPRCIIARQQQRRLDRQRDAEAKAAIVAAVTRRFVMSHRRKREARKAKFRKQRRAA